MSDGESAELRKFRELGCKDRPGSTAEERPAIEAARAIPFDRAFAVKRRCAQGHTYRGARCQSCERHDPPGGRPPDYPAAA